MPYWTYVNQTLNQMFNATFAAFTFNQLVMATCGCDSQPINSTQGVATWGNAAFLALNNTADLFNNGTTFNISNMVDYRATYCSYLGAGARGALKSFI